MVLPERSGAGRQELLQSPPPPPTHAPHALCRPSPTSVPTTASTPISCGRSSKTTTCSWQSWRPSTSELTWRQLPGSFAGPGRATRRGRAAAWGVRRSWAQPCPPLRAGQRGNCGARHLGLHGTCVWRYLRLQEAVPACNGGGPARDPVCGHSRREQAQGRDGDGGGESIGQLAGSCWPRVTRRSRVTSVWSWQQLPNPLGPSNCARSRLLSNHLPADTGPPLPPLLAAPGALPNKRPRSPAGLAMYAGEPAAVPEAAEHSG